jgi:hypothetical protein
MLVDAYSPAGTGAGTAALGVDATDAATADICGVPIPPASLSRVSAYDWFGSVLGDPLGLALAGILAAGIGMSRTLWIAAAVDLVAGAAMIVAPSVRNLQRPGGPQPGPGAPQPVTG